MGGARRICGGWRRLRADQQKSAAAALTNCRRRRRGAAGAQLYVALDRNLFFAYYCSERFTSLGNCIRSFDNVLKVSKAARLESNYSKIDTCHQMSSNNGISSDFHALCNK